MKNNRNEPAFPQISASEIDSMALINLEGGLTKREYFTAMIAPGFVGKGSFPWEEYAKMAVIFADALLVELEKTNKE